MFDLGEDELLWVLGGISAVFAVTLFFFIRSLIEARERRFATRLVEASADVDEGLLPRGGKPMGKMDHFLSHTGLEMSAEQAVGWMTFLSVAIAATLYFVRPEWWVSLIGLVFGCGGVWITLIMHRFRHRLKLQEQLPDTIFLVSRSLRAGLSLEQALSLVGNQGIEPIATEFRKANSQISLGLTIPQAMELMAKRLHLDDFNSLVSTISLYSTTGGNLPLLLDRLASSTRDHNQFRAFYRSATALGRISAICIASAGPIFFVVYALTQPEYAEFFLTSQVGLMTLGMAMFLEIIGLIWLWNIIRIDY